MVFAWFVGFIDVPVKLACVWPAVRPASATVTISTKAIARRRSLRIRRRLPKVFTSGGPNAALRAEPCDVRAPDLIRVEGHGCGASGAEGLHRSRHRDDGRLFTEDERPGAGEEREIGRAHV